MRQVVKTIISNDARFKAEIVRRPFGLIVDVFRWTEEWADGYGKVAEFWEMVSRGITITDTMERADELARDALRSRESASA